MKKIQSRKLVLHAESIVQLSVLQLRNAAGGVRDGSGISACTIICPPEGFGGPPER